MPPTAAIDEVEACLARFEQAWQERPPACLEDFLPSTGARRRFLHDAIPIDLEYRWCRSDEATGVRLTLDDYRQRFPELGQVNELPVFLIGEEYRVRCWAGTRPTHTEFARRFPAQAKQLEGTLRALDAELAHQPRVAAQEVVQLPASGAALLEQLLQLELLDGEQHNTLTALPEGDVATVARQLVEAGWLTPFQAELATRGRAAQLMIGPYVLVDRIGAGWSSNVFRARHRMLARTVALKVFRRELLQGIEPAVVKRFYQEMHALGRLNHPNVVLAYDAGPAGSSLFVAMEYVGGIDLQHYVQQHGPLPVEQVVDFLYQAALGLQHACEHGLVHRDIKPSNLLLVPAAQSTSHPFGQLKLLDLGLARVHQAVRTGSASALTRTGCLMGTADYMAPEQGFDPRRVDIRADLYSLGCTAYFLLTGQPPFAGGTFLQKMNRHRSEPPAALSTRRTDVPPPLVNLVQQLLAKEPADRPAAPAAVCAALEPLRPRRALPAGQPRLSRLGLGAAALILIGLVVAFVWPRDQAARPVPAPARVSDRKPPPQARHLEFDGQDDIVILPDRLIAGAKELTLEARFQTIRGGVIFGYQNLPYDQRPGQFVSALYVGRDGLLHGDLWNQSHFRLASRSRVDDGHWHHAALVAAAGRVALYLDGQLEAEVQGTVDHLQMIHNQVGAGFTSDHLAGNNGWFLFQGELDELRIWHAGRSAAELRRFMNLPLHGNETGLAAYYPITGNDPRLLDRTPAARHLTVPTQGPRLVVDE